MVENLLQKNIRNRSEDYEYFFVKKIEHLSNILDPDVLFLICLNRERSGIEELKSVSTYQRLISILTIVLLCWNFAGTLVSGLVVNHLHSQDNGDFCEITFCSCNVEKGQKICTCHHPELQHINHNHDGDMAESHHNSSHDQEAGFCYFSANHNQAQSIPTVLIEFNKLNAVCLADAPLIYSYKTDRLKILHKPSLPSGITDELLKPPRA